MNREKIDSEIDSDSELPCLRKQRDGRGLNPCVGKLTTRPHTPPLKSIKQISKHRNENGESNEAKGKQD